MKKILALLSLVGVVFSATLVLAKEPVNLAVIKQQLIRYHDSGAYDQDISKVAKEALRYLQLRIKRQDFAGKKPAIVVDIDETALSNYADMLKLDFGGTSQEVNNLEDTSLDPAIKPVLELYRFARDNHVAIIFLTGRDDSQRVHTSENLKAVGYEQWDALIMRDAQNSKNMAVIYKANKRKELIAQGYDILLTIGDQKSDLMGGYADKAFKLPNPYYFIP